MTETKIVVFRIAGQDYAADIRDVQEVIRSPSITPLPHPTPPLLGVFNLRGHIVTALDGHAALGFGSSPTPSARTVVFHTSGRTVGLLVETASHVLTIDEASVRPNADAQDLAAAKGIIIHDGRPIVLLDIPFLISQRPTVAPRATP